jgi:hypothetical protein
MPKKLKFEKFIESKFKGLNFLSISNDTFKPGVILNNDDRIIDSLWRIFPKQSANKWKTTKVDSTIAGYTIEGERALDITGKVLGVFSLQAGVTAKYSISFEFSECQSLVFDTEAGGIYENEARNLIMKLKETDRATWKDILHEYITMESVYVESFTAKFKREGKVVTSAEIEKVSQEVKVSAAFSWKTNGVMEIKNNQNPLGVRGFTVKRFM